MEIILHALFYYKGRKINMSGTRMPIGKVCPIPKGNWSSDVEYDKLNLVNYNGVVYIGIKENIPVGTAVTNTEYWMRLTNPLTIGTVTSSSPGGNAAVTITSNNTQDTLNITLPRGLSGNETIDDTAGENSIDVIWSADKSYKEIVKKAEGLSIKSEITIPGGITYSNGADRDTSFYTGAYKRSGYLPVYKGDILVYDNVYINDSSCVVAYYNTNQTYDSSKSVAGIGSDTQHGIVVFDANGYIRISCTNTYLDNAKFVVYNSSQYIKINNENKVFRQTAVKSNFLLLNVAELKRNNFCSIHTTSGVPYSTPSRENGVTEFFPCNAGDKLKYKLSIDNGYPILATYDEYFNLVRISVTGTGGPSYIENTYTFQADEKYFRVSAKTADNYTTNYYLQYETTVTVFDQINSTFTAMDNRLTALEEHEGSVSLPDYWKTYLDAKIPALQNIECDLGNKGIEFAFVTDTHVPANQMQSPAVLKYLYNKLSFPFVINGGDTLDTSPTKADALEKFYSWKEAMKGLPEFCVLGNHDKNSLSQDDPTAELTSSQFYRMMNADMEDNKFADFSTAVDTNNIYYLIDNPDQKFRIIVLSTSFGYSSSALEPEWLKTKLTELDSTWSVLVVTHYMWHVVPDMHAVGTAILNAINEVYTQINAKFVGVLAGHCHEDYNIIEPTYGYNVIATICDGMRSGELYNRTIGTITEQAFDMVFINTENRTMKLVRIGAGDDTVGDGTGIRTFTY